MGLHTWGIYKDGGADRGNLLGQVRKSNSKQADITLEKTPQNSYTAQGNLADMTYTIKTGNQIAAQASLSAVQQTDISMQSFDAWCTAESRPQLQESLYIHYSHVKLCNHAHRATARLLR